MNRIATTSSLTTNTMVKSTIINLRFFLDIDVDWFFFNYKLGTVRSYNDTISYTAQQWTVIMYSMMHINDIINQIVIIRFSEDSMSLFIISCRSSDTYNLPDPIDMVAHQYWQASPTHHNMEMDSLIRCWHAGNGDLLSTRKCGCNFNSVFFLLISRNDIFYTITKLFSSAYHWTPLMINTGSGDRLQVTSHYVSQCWPRSMMPYGIAKPQWVNKQIIIPSHIDAWPKLMIL